MWIKIISCYIFEGIFIGEVTTVTEATTTMASTDENFNGAPVVTTAATAKPTNQVQIDSDVIKIMEKKFEGLHVDWNRKFIRNSFIGE